MISVDLHSFVEAEARTWTRSGSSWVDLTFRTERGQFHMTLFFRGAHKEAQEFAEAINSVRKPTEPPSDLHCKEGPWAGGFAENH